MFPFPDPTATSLVLAPANGRSSVCFSIGGGTLTNSNCDAASPAAGQVFTIGDANPAPTQPPSGGEEEPVEEPSETASQPPAETQAPSPAPAVPTGSVRLDLEATAEAQRRDNGATRAFTAVAIKVSLFSSARAIIQ